jgi:uncharacterized membrane protein YfcA
MIDGSFAVAGAVTGLVVGLSGVGGGALMTPLLLLFFDVAPATAIATDLWFAAITKMFGARVHHAAGNVDWQIARCLWWGSVPIALLVVSLVAFGGHIAKVDWLTQAIGAVVLFTAVGLLLAPWSVVWARQRKEGRAETARPVPTVLAGAAVGLCVALTSVGAGALGSVMLLYLYPTRLTPHRLVATDLVHAIPLALVAGVGYLFAGMVDGEMLLSLLSGSIPAVLVGSRLATKFSGRGIQVTLAAVLMAVGLKVFV